MAKKPDSSKLTKTERSWLRKKLKWEIWWNKTRMLDRPKAEVIGVNLRSIRRQTRIMERIVEKLNLDEKEIHDGRETARQG